MSKRLYIVAGESSGDLHAANAVEELKKLHPGIQLRGMGGDRLSAAGMELLLHYREMNVMGFVEVIRHLKRVIGNLSKVKADILSFRPDLVMLVDFPAFNLRLAKFCRHHDIPVVYYISPQIWAWKTSRVKLVRRDVTRMITILPFEKAFYAKHDVQVDYVGHPLLDAIGKNPFASRFREEHGLTGLPIVAMLPGSRKMEISQMLPLMATLAEKYRNDYQFVIAGAPSISAEFYAPYLKNGNMKLVHGQTYSLLQNASSALVTSGTATLETALFNVPQVVCYKGNVLSYHLAKRLIKVNYISLVNLILDRPSVKELIQHEFNPQSLEQEFLAINGQKRETMLRDYEELRQLLGRSGASANAAQLISDMLKG